MWELYHKESWALKNRCFWTVVLKKTLESPLHFKEIKPVHPKGDQSWKFMERTDAEAEAPILGPPDAHWKRPWCWERLKAGGEGDDRGWDGWMASPIQWTWVWASSGSWWQTGKPGVLQSMGSQRVRYDWMTELISIEESSTFTSILEAEAHFYFCLWISKEKCTQDSKLMKANLLWPKGVRSPEVPPEGAVHRVTWGIQKLPIRLVRIF